MSLAKLALRISAVQAIRGRTLVQENVLDSEIGAISESATGAIETDKDKPFIAVYTDKDKYSADGSNGQGFFENGSCTLVLESGVTANMSYVDEETGAVVGGIGIPDTDRSREAMLDVVDAQIKHALKDPQNEWADLCLRFILSVQSVETIRAGNASGVRISAHQTKIVCSLIDDPQPGEPLDEQGAFFLFLQKIEGADNQFYNKIAEIIRGLVSGERNETELLQHRLGLRAEELLSLGYGAVKDTDGNEANISTIEIETPVGQVSVTS